MDASKPLVEGSQGPSYGGTGEQAPGSSFPATNPAQKEEDDEMEPEQSSGIFPFEPFWILGPVQAFLPGTWRRIVSLPHLVLLVGIIACAIILCSTVASWARSGCRTQTCQGRWVPLVFVGLCLMYFVATIQQYDEALQQKQKELQKAKRELERQYQETVSEMQGLLNKAVDNQVMLAEQSFESHRRDFSRFLLRYERDASKEAGVEVLPPFRGFLLQWLVIFSECSIDPIKKPLKVLTAEDMDPCANSGEVALLLESRVKAAEVKFVSNQRERDKEEVSRQRSRFRAIVTTQKEDLKKRQSVCGAVPAFCDVDLEEGLKLDKDAAPGEYRWVQWGRTKPFGMERDEATGSFPFAFHFGCVSIILLSMEHLRLLMAFLLGWPILVFEVVQAVDGNGLTAMKLELVIEVVVCLVCIVFLLHQFLDIDILQQLEAQLRELEAKKDEVDNKRTRIVGFFEATQQLADLWTHRTLTRLELMKHLQEKLLDAPPADHVVLLSTVNEKVETLESSMPALEHWRNEDTISAKKKKMFGSAMADLYQDRGDLQATLSIMTQASRQIKAALSDQPLAPDPALENQGKEDGGTGSISPAAVVLESLGDFTAVDEAEYKPGDRVEYLSASQGRWVPATVRHRHPVTGLYDLDCKDEVPPEKVRPPQNSDGGCKQQ